jgi:hypothetical protein
MAKPTSQPPSAQPSKSVGKARRVDPLRNRPANAEESSPETLVPEIVRSTLHQSQGDGAAADLRKRIAERAYELAEHRGFSPGAALEDWLCAEREMQAAPVEQAPEDQFTG